MSEIMSPKTLNDLGDAYYFGIERPKNQELAYTYYKQAADQDNPVGLYNVGMYFYDKKDFAKAKDYLEKSHSCGHSPASLLLGEMYKTGDGFRKSKKKAFKMFLEAANLNDIDGYNAVGECYLKGIGCGKNPEKALEFYQKSADQQNMIGELQVGLYHLESPAYKKSPEKALFWLDKAASHGSVEALKKIYEIYSIHSHPFFRKKSVTSLQEMAFFYQEALAKTGDIPSLKAVADTYFNGNEVTKKNLEKSSTYYRDLTVLGDNDGKYGFAISLLYGLGVRQDIETAKKLLEECAKASHPSALTRLGDIFRLGLNVPIDFEEAKKWYMEGARLNDSEAVMNLGLLNYREQVANASPVLAFNFMDTAAKKGYFQALYWLGIFYDKGIGCPHSFSEAEKCFQKAISKGSLGAKYKFATMILDNMATEKIPPKRKNALYDEAKRLLFEYVQDPLRNSANSAYAMDYLGQIFGEGLGTIPNPKISRYWYESASEANLAKSMVEMYRILKDKEFDAAFEWLKKATRDSTCAEAFYELGLLYQNGYPERVKIDLKLAKVHFETASKLNHKGALEKLIMM